MAATFSAETLGDAEHLSPMRFIGLALLIVIPGMLRQVVRIAVGWSTVMLFGKVPRAREPYIFVMSVGSICWIIAAVSVVISPVGTFLLGFLPLPERLDSLIAWYIMLSLTVAIPPLVAVAILRALQPDDRPKGFATRAGMLLKGYSVRGQPCPHPGADVSAAAPQRASQPWARP